jgi:hypothetical protein
MRNTIILFIFTFIVQLSFGQRTETAIDFSQKKNRFVFETENDMLFNSDSYYTAGIAFSYTHKNLQKTPAQFLLKPKNDSVYTFTGFGFQQRMFTPFSITEPNSIANDQPYSAYLLITNYSVLINPKKKLKISNEIGFGMMGEKALGEEIQSIVHEIVGSPIPIGWENQLQNSFLIDYQFRIEKGFFNDWTAEHLVPFAAARVGTLTNRVQFGLAAKFGNKSKHLKLNETSLKSNEHFIWEWVYEANLQGVFYDATLQGGMFGPRDPNALEKKDVISAQFQMRTGLNLFYKRYSLRYMIFFNSTNFVTAKTHSYGSVNLGFSF